MPPIHYLPHELSPMLKVLDDRVTQVVAMSTRPQSYAHPQIQTADMQMALMKTEKDAIMRMGASFSQPHPEANYHWYHIQGTGGQIEWKRAERDRPRMWLADAHMHVLAEVDWRYERTDAPHEARGSGHGDADYYVQAALGCGPVWQALGVRRTGPWMAARGHPAAESSPGQHTVCARLSPGPARPRERTSCTGPGGRASPSMVASGAGGGEHASAYCQPRTQVVGRAPYAGGCPAADPRMGHPGRSGVR